MSEKFYLVHLWKTKCPGPIPIDLTSILKSLLRNLRRRAVLALIFVLSLVYCLTSLFWPQTAHLVMGYSREDLDPDSLLPPKVPSEQFQWHREEPAHNETDANHQRVTNCRNSVQGKVLIADDRGYLCQRLDTLSNGCCNVKSERTRLYSCATCMENGCCSIYEHCISCCLQPDKRLLLQRVMGEASDTFRLLFASITDHFELCLAKCRTSSQSVHHENSYRDPKAKHCYGESTPVVHSPVA